MISSAVTASSPVALTDRLAALADPVRLRVVEVLAGGGRCVCDLHGEVPAAAGMPLPGARVITERRGSAREDDEDGRGD